MLRVLWIDDLPGQHETLADSLRKHGYEVQLVRSDREAIQRIERGPVPDVIVQDLHRESSHARFDFLPPRRPASFPHDVGWAFYRDVLAPGLPQVPVIIVSADADKPKNQKTAEDFNLTILQKGTGLREALPRALGNAIRAQRLLLSPQEVPAVVSVDFETVNAALLRHLAKHPSDLDHVGWAKFEELIEVLLKELGYDVTRTRLTRDGGVDLWALQRSDLGATLYAVDAKKYNRKTIVGPEPVRAIYGVADLADATAGMIVTTATFGPAARQLAEQYRYRVSLKAFEDVAEWIRRVARP